jgi:hypothetical protein
MIFPTLYMPTIDFTLLAATSILFIGAVLTVETPSLRRWVLPTMGCGTLAAASLLLNLRWVFPAAIPVWLAPFSHSVLEFAKIYHLMYALQTLVARDAELDPMFLLLSNHILHIFLYDYLRWYRHVHSMSLLLIQSMNGFLQALGRLRGTSRGMLLLQSYTRLATSLWLLYQYWTLHIPAAVFGAVVITNFAHHSLKLAYPYSQAITEPML